MQNGVNLHILVYALVIPSPTGCAFMPEAAFLGQPT
jgi:hypothetical protein